jgi:hypothetical protein
MENKAWMQGMITFTALAGLLQAVAHGAITMTDLMFIVLVTAFFVALEHDYNKYKQRVERKKNESISFPGEQQTPRPLFGPTKLPCLNYVTWRSYALFLGAGTFLFFLKQIVLEKYGLFVFRYRILCRS